MGSICGCEAQRVPSERQGAWSVYSKEEPGRRHLVQRVRLGEEETSPERAAACWGHGWACPGASSSCRSLFVLLSGASLKHLGESWVFRLPLCWALWPPPVSPRLHVLLTQLHPLSGPGGGPGRMTQKSGPKEAVARAPLHPDFPGLSQREDTQDLLVLQGRSQKLPERIQHPAGEGLAWPGQQAPVLSSLQRGCSPLPPVKAVRAKMESLLSDHQPRQPPIREAREVTGGSPASARRQASTEDWARASPSQGTQLRGRVPATWRPPGRPPLNPCPQS